MATYTSNLDLKKPAQSDKIRIADINNNMDTIDSTIGAIGTRSVTEQLTDIEGSIAIVSTGNVHVAISAGQYIYIKGHDTLSDGLYTANSALAANATLSSSNVTAVSGGGLNSLSNQITNLQKNADIISTATTEFVAGQTMTLTNNCDDYEFIALQCNSNATGNPGQGRGIALIPTAMSASCFYPLYIGATSGYIRIALSNNTIVFDGMSFTTLYVYTVYGIGKRK